MLYTLNNNYVLRQELNDCYRLYNKKTLRSYTTVSYTHLTLPTTERV